MARVFITATSPDLDDYRLEAAIVAQAAGFDADLQEAWTDEDHPPLEDELQALLIRRWYAAADPDHAEEKADGLIDHLGGRSDLAELKSELPGVPRGRVSGAYPARARLVRDRPLPHRPATPGDLPAAGARRQLGRPSGPGLCREGLPTLSGMRHPRLWLRHNDGGFSLDASVRIPAWDRAGLERLLRYCARPPFAPERLEVIDDEPSTVHFPHYAGDFRPNEPLRALVRELLPVVSSPLSLYRQRASSE